ncbi:MAG: DNA primase [Candidatus Omnitrophica bacterium]|nr:DNA primase [Candidatus Omnitrophota bacterium]
MISDRTLREIQDRLDIVEVVGGYVTLRRSGKNFKALCPFHPEKTPSFMIYPHKQFFICYGCGAGGDMVSFVMKHEHMEFPEAVELLAQKAGLEISFGRGGRKTNAHLKLYQAHESAARFFQELLMSPEGEAARAYLKKRGLTEETWETFSVGYAPSGWDRFLQKAAGEGLTPQVLERAGLAVAREGKAGWYDRFRNRVVFPIWDTRGRVIAFGGRVFDEEGPKYLNSPETELYVKGKILYGIHLAAPHIREKDFCIVVEGYLDMIAPYQQGIRNVVASMGTSLTESQIQLIRRYTKNVVMVYDGDYAGEMATLRGLDLLLAGQMRVKVAGLPEGLDPDSMIRTQGIKAFAKAIQGSEDLFDYKLNLLKKRFDPKMMEGRVRICEEMLPTIKRVANTIQRGEYIRRLGDLLGVAEDLLWTELGKVKLDARWKPSSLTAAEAVSASVPTAEESLAGLLMENPQRMALVADRLSTQMIQDPLVRRVIEWLTERFSEQQLPEDHRRIVDALGRDAGDAQSRFVRWLAWADTVEEEEKEWTVNDLLRRIEEERRKASVESLKASIRQAEEAGDQEKAVLLVLEMNRLIKTTSFR